MKHTALFLLTIVLFALPACKPTDNTPAPDSTDTASSGIPNDAGETPAAEEQPSGEEQTPPPDNIVNIPPVDREQTKVLSTFAPLEEVFALARRSVGMKDSLESLRQTEELTDPNDSLIFRPHEDRAYRAILSYQQRMASGITLTGPSQNIVDLERDAVISREAEEILDAAGASNVLANGKFFFLGGAPFITKLTEDEGSVYNDPQGKPETRFEASLTENTDFLMNSLFRARKERVNITFGPPLQSYDYGPNEVNGIGSLVHEFANRIPVYFLTEEGAKTAYLISIVVKVVPQNMGCLSDQAQMIFAYPGALEGNDILGVYLPFQTAAPASCSVNRVSTSLWTMDINGDNIPDLACVSGTFEGIASDYMNESVWYVNINGEWKVIDRGSDPDCT